MNPTPRLRMLVLGDGFMPTDVFRAAFQDLSDVIAADYVQLQPSTFTPSTSSEAGLSETFGTPAQVIDALGGHCIVVAHAAPITAEVLDAAPGLVLIGCARGGPVNVDVAAATQRGIVVVNTPGKNSEAVADLTIAFLLSLARHLPLALDSVETSGTIGTSTFDGARFIGRELSGQTLGLVGLGNVGRLVAARADALGMTIQAADPYLDPEQTPPGVRIVELDRLLATSDFVSLHARARADNRHLISHEQLRLMKSSAYLINTARESLVDEPALIAALDQGVIAGAAMDVLEIGDGGRHPLVGRPDVIVTPHIGGATQETLIRGAEMVAEDVARVLAGLNPMRPVNDVVARSLVAS